MFLSVASAGGSVVEDPECLRLREEGDERDGSDDIFLQRKGWCEGETSAMKSRIEGSDQDQRSGRSGPRMGTNQYF